jgi:chromate transporter
LHCVLLAKFATRETAMTTDQLFNLFLQFCSLSLVAVGGALSTAGDMHRYMVDEHKLLASNTFADSIALAQIAPGPNILFVTLLGLQAGGPWGALATTLGILLPSSFLTFKVFRLRQRYSHTVVMRSISMGLAPLAIGMITMTGFTLAKAANSTWYWLLACLITVLVAAFSRLNPLWLIGAGAAAGLLVETFK